jgi:5'-3' exonuclease
VSKAWGATLGVNLRDLFPSHPVPPDWYAGKRIAVDGHNVAFRYLSSLRGPDGGPLRNKDGRAIGHLIGYVNLVRHLRERGAEPIVVWDGDIHEKKRRTVEERTQQRKHMRLNASTLEGDLAQAHVLGPQAFGLLHRADLAAQVRLLEALLPQDPDVAGELAERRRDLEKAALLTDAQLGAFRTVQLEDEVLQARRRVTALDGVMIEDCSQVLRALGVAVQRAPHDGERYAAALCRDGHADAVATEDFDALVAGAPAVLRKAGSQQPFLHRLEDLHAHGLSATQLRWVAILCGTDWHPGVKGFGAKTAVKALKEFPDLRDLIQQAGLGTGTSRWHRLVKEAGLTLADFDEMDAFIADLPQAPPPKPGEPRPDVAVDLAGRLGLDPKRMLACFC